MNTVNETAVIDGVAMPLAEASLPMSDLGVTRGDGGFETMGVWGGQIFRREDHLQRLAHSLSAAKLPPADPKPLNCDIDAVLDRGLDGQSADAALRIYITGSGTRVVILSAQPVRQPNLWLEPVVAPWIRPTGTYALAGAKTMSYMPNMTLSRVAQEAGADDALLVSLEGMVLEGPTFGVVWASQGVLYAPATELGIVDSISRRTVLELANEHDISVAMGAFDVAALRNAEEVMTSSAVRPLQALRRFADHEFATKTPVTDMLARGLEARRRDDQ